MTLFKRDGSARKQRIESLIPRNFRFLWGFWDSPNPISEDHASRYRRWQKLNPPWQITLQTAEKVEEFVHQYDHKYDRQMYLRFLHPVQRFNACRPIILHELGGVYCDLDLQPLRPMDELLKKYSAAQVLLVEEATLSRRAVHEIGKKQPIRNGHDPQRLQIANYWMASTPYHPFWPCVLKLLQQRSGLKVEGPYDVKFTTGSDVIGEAYHQTKGKFNDVVVIPKRIAAKYFRHLSAGSWQKTF